MTTQGNLNQQTLPSVVPSPHSTIAILNCGYANLDGHHNELIDPAIIAACQNGGYKIKEITSPAISKTISKDTSKTIQNADLGLIDLRNTFLDEEIATAISNIARNRRFQLLFLINVHTPKHIVEILSHAGRLCFGDELISQLNDDFREMTRAKTILSEYKRREQSVRENNYSLPERACHNKAVNKTILIAGKPGKNILALINALEANGHTIKCAYRPSQAIRALESNMIDGAIFFPTQKGDPLIALARTMRRHTRYKSVPVIHILENDPSKQEMIKSMRGANSILLNDHIVPFGAITIENILFYAKTIASLQAQLRSIGSEENALPTIRDTQSKLYMADFFAHHSHAICAANDEAGRSINILALHITRDKKINISHQKILQQIGPLIDRIIRAEDFIGHLGNEKYGSVCAATLNGCSEADAYKIAGRISSIIHNTMFYDNQGAPVPLQAHAKVYTRPKGLCIEETVAGIINSVR